MEAPPIFIRKGNPEAARWWVAGGFAAALVIGLALFRFDPTQYHYYPRCMLYVTTGLYCPGCGVLRSLHQLTHGHLLTALRYNPLFIVSLPLVGWLAWRYVPRWIAGEVSPPLKSSWIKIGVVVVVLFSILRNIPIAPFNWLSPP